MVGTTDSVLIREVSLFRVLFVESSTVMHITCDPTAVWRHPHAAVPIIMAFTHLLIITNPYKLLIIVFATMWCDIIIVFTNTWYDVTPVYHCVYTCI